MNFGKVAGIIRTSVSMWITDFSLIDQKIVDKRIISTYASSGDLPVLGIRDEPDYVDKPDLCRLASFIEALVHSFEN